MTTSRSWTPAEDAIIHAHYAQDGPTATVQHLVDAGYGRTRLAVEGRAHELRRSAIREAGADTGQLRTRRDRRWSPAEEAIVREHYETAGPSACLGRLHTMGAKCTREALREYARRLGLRAPRKPRTRPSGNAKLLAVRNTKPCDPELELRLTALVALAEAALRARPGLGAAECVGRVVRAANEDPGALGMVTDRIAWERARRRASA